MTPQEVFFEFKPNLASLWILGPINCLLSDKGLSGTDHHAMDLNFIARDEQLDIQDPLRHYMQEPDDTGETNPDESHELSSELLSVLPRQSHSVHDEILKLSFLNSEDDLQPPVTITLAMDAAPGCGGIAWPAGQVRII